MQKKYTNYAEQVTILAEKGVTIKDVDFALRSLKREGYYNLINGYKDLFLEISDNGTERFKEGTTFHEIYNLYLLDREMRNLVFGYLLQFETTMRSLIADSFCSVHDEVHSYLEVDNYVENDDDSDLRLDVIAKLQKIIKKESKREGAVNHFLSKYDYVPLWVLTNFMTFGVMQNMYNCLQQGVQNEIAKYFGLEYKASYGKSNPITHEALTSVLKSVKFFRNICAHEDRLYNYKIHKKPATKQIAAIINVPLEQLENGNFFTLIASLKIVTPKEDYAALKKSLNGLFEKYNFKFESISFKEIMETMGFPTDWITLL